MSEFLIEEKDKIDKALTDVNHCIWIGIGVDIKKKDNLYKEWTSINKILSNGSANTLSFSENRLAHLNLYDLDIPKDNLNKIQEELNKIATQMKSFGVPIKAVRHFPFGLFYIEVEKSKPLLKLHKTIVEKISPLKADCICQDYLEPHRKYNQTQKLMLKKYGNPHVLSQFSPHITLSFTKNKNLQSIQKEARIKLTENTLRVDDFHVVTEKREYVRNFKLN